MQLFPSFELLIEAEPLAVRDGLAKILAALDPLALNVEDAATVELVLAEVLNNVSEHAYRDKNSAPPIHVLCQPERRGLQFTVTDHGHPFPDAALPGDEPAALDVERAALPEGGFGWSMIHALARDIRYRRKASTNELTLCLPMKVASAIKDASS
ncbi:ATP-binding protein [uncultured Roseobacter sp.]|uniref:ATP-binding protein n=1 Tax=uncultured Roseobacter sp. TaxID=114847 RepID=UPI0026290D50|nr:ATP-binding protein [uncultured Roseobacter sp.]